MKREKGKRFLLNLSGFSGPHPQFFKGARQNSNVSGGYFF